MRGALPRFCLHDQGVQKSYLPVAGRGREGGGERLIVPQWPDELGAVTKVLPGRLWPPLGAPTMVVTRVATAASRAGVANARPKR